MEKYEEKKNYMQCGSKENYNVKWRWTSIRLELKIIRHVNDEPQV